MENFKLLLDKAIKPLIDDALSRNKRCQIGYGSEKELEMYNDIEAKFNNLKDETIKDFMLQDNCRLDRHKLCACIYIAIVDIKPLKIADGSSRKDMLINAYIAFMAACKTLSFFIIDDAVVGSDFENFLKCQKTLCFPSPIRRNPDSNDSYIIQTVKGLYNTQKQNSLNVPNLANIFFLLESNTVQCYEIYRLGEQIARLAR